VTQWLSGAASGGDCFPRPFLSHWVT